MRNLKEYQNRIQGPVGHIQNAEFCGVSLRSCFNLFKCNGKWNDLADSLLQK